MIDLRRRDGRVLRIGHRGAAALEPENTLRSLRRAIELGVDLVEFDVLELDDGTLVLAHSDRLYELSHGRARGRVRRRTLPELRRVAPELPTLDEALELLAGTPTVGLDVELKRCGHEAALVRALRRYGVAERTIVTSYRTAALSAVRAQDPDIRVGVVYPADRYGLGRLPLAPLAAPAASAFRRALPHVIGSLLSRVRAAAAMLQYRVVSRAVVERCHELDAGVFAWTVDDRRVAQGLAALGVDGVITNDPGIFGGAD